MTDFEIPQESKYLISYLGFSFGKVIEITLTDKYNNKEICNAFRCSKNVMEKINVSADTLETISLNICKNCVRKFD